MINNQPNQEILDKMMQIAESIYRTKENPEEMPIVMESWYKLQSLSQNCVLYETDEKGELISWVVVMPTNKELMKKFIDHDINERELLEMAKPEEKYSALYFCSAITISKYRRKGHALNLFKEIINKISLTEDYELFSWTITKEGEGLKNKLTQELRKEILMRK